MAISVESSKSKILISVNYAKSYYLERAFYKNKIWLVWTGNGFANPSEETTEPLEMVSGDFVDSFDLEDGLYEYRIVASDIEEPQFKDYEYSCWVKFGIPNAIGYSFNNYSAPQGCWGEVVTPDDCRYTYLWGTDFKATNGEFFTDEQIRWFIQAATNEVERLLDITIVKQNIKSELSIRENNLIKGKDYDVEEPLYDFTFRKIQRYGMIQTKHRPILNVTRCTLINRGYSDDKDLLSSTFLEKKSGLIKFLSRPYKPSETWQGISQSISRYGSETWNNHLFYAVDYSAGYENSDEIPIDLRQIIGKVAAISLLNIIGDGLMSGFSSSSLSMDGVSESFSSTQSATSAYFGARIAVYQKEVQEYIEKNKYRFGFYRVGCL